MQFFELNIGNGDDGGRQEIPTNNARAVVVVVVVRISLVCCT